MPVWNEGWSVKGTVSYRGGGTFNVKMGTNALTWKYENLDLWLLLLQGIADDDNAIIPLLQQWLHLVEESSTSEQSVDMRLACAAIITQNARTLLVHPGPVLSQGGYRYISHY